MTGAGPEAVVSGRDVGYRYLTADGPVQALDGVSLTAGPGAFLVASGPSGSGKSTLLRLLAGIDAPTTGRIDVAGVRLDGLGGRARRRFRRRHVAHLLQSPADNLVAELTVDEHLRHAAAVRRIPAVDPERVLAGVGLEGRGPARPHQLSGGEQQRLALACATVADTTVLLADEPTAHLDPTSTTALVGLIEGLARRGVCVIVASHDPLVVERATSVVELHYGRQAGR